MDRLAHVANKKFYLQATVYVCLGERRLQNLSLRQFDGVKYLWKLAMPNVQLVPHKLETVSDPPTTGGFEVMNNIVDMVLRFLG